MARPNNSTLLLPLLEVIALIYPIAFGPKLSPPPGGPATSPPHQNPNGNDILNNGPAELHNAQSILTDFFDETPIRGDGPES